MSLPGFTARVVPNELGHTQCTTRIACCRLLKSEALKHTLSGQWPRFRFNHNKGAYEIGNIYKCTNRENKGLSRSKPDTLP